MNNKTNGLKVQFIGGQYPQVGPKYRRVVVIKSYYPTDFIGNLVHICKSYGADIVPTIKSLEAQRAMELLLRERKTIFLNLKELSKDPVRNSQTIEDEKARLEMVSSQEQKIMNHESLFAVDIDIVMKSDNTVTLMNKVPKLISELYVAGFTAFEPMDQDGAVSKWLSIPSNVGTEGSNTMYVPISDLAKILVRLTPKHNIFNDPQGFLFGFTHYGEAVLEDITKLTSGGLGRILGKTGAGKSYAMAAIAHYMYLRDYKVIIMDPKGQGMADVSFQRLLDNHENAVCLREPRINPFDIFPDDLKKQRKFERNALGLLFKGISESLLDIICQQADSMRNAAGLKQIPTFKAMKDIFEAELGKKTDETTDTYGPEWSRSVETKQRKENLLAILKCITPFTRGDTETVFGSTTEKLRHNETYDITGFDFSYLKDNEFAKKAMIALSLLWVKAQMGERRTFVLIDELHEVLEEYERIGSPSAADTVKYIITQGRALNTVLVGAAQSQLLLELTEAGKALEENHSWTLFLGQHEDDESLKSMGIPEDHRRYLAKIPPYTPGQGLLLVRGKGSVIVSFEVPEYLHEMLTGKPKTAHSIETLEHVLRPQMYTSAQIKSLVKDMDYRLVKHKELSDKKQEFLMRRSVDPLRLLDMFLIQEELGKMGICNDEIEVDHDMGFIVVRRNVVIYIPPYDGKQENIQSLSQALDSLTKDWIVVIDPKHHNYNLSTTAFAEKVLPRSRAVSTINKFLISRA